LPKLLPARQPPSELYTMSNDEDLFKLFSPTYHFDEPIKSNDSDWCIVAEQSILVEEEIFWNVIVSSGHSCHNVSPLPWS